MPDPSVESLIIDGLNRVESKVDSGFTAVDIKLDSKADKGDLRELRGELRSHHDRIARLEESDRAREIEQATERDGAERQARVEREASERKHRRTTQLLTVLGTCALIAGVLTPFLVH